MGLENLCDAGSGVLASSENPISPSGPEHAKSKGEKLLEVGKIREVIMELIDSSSQVVLLLPP